MNLSATFIQSCKMGKRAMVILRMNLFTYNSPACIATAAMSAFLSTSRLALIALVGLWFIPQTASACSCGQASPEEELRGASLIFHGTVISIQSVYPDADLPDAPSWKKDSMRARFKISRQFKGPDFDEIDIAYYGGSGASCGIKFIVGQERLINAGGTQEKGYRTGYCDGLTQNYQAYLNVLETYRAKKHSLADDIRNLGETDQKLRDQANFLLSHRDIELAEKVFEQLVEKLPQDIEALLKRAQIRYNLQRYELALSDYRRILTINQDHLAAHKGETFSLLKLNRANELKKNTLDFAGFYDDGSPMIAFMGMNLSGANFRGAKLHSTIFSGTDLRNADFSEASLRNCNFENANLAGTKFDQLKDAYGTKFLDANLSNTSFIGAFIFGAKFEAANLDNANFKNARAEMATFAKASLSHTNFEGAQLLGAQFNGAIFTNNNLRNTDLRQADFREATLSNVDLRGARFGTANYSGRFTDFRNTDLSSTNTAGAEWGAISVNCRTIPPRGVALYDQNVVLDWTKCDGEKPVLKRDIPSRVSVP